MILFNEGTVGARTITNIMVLYSSYSYTSNTPQNYVGNDFRLDVLLLYSDLFGKFWVSSASVCASVFTEQGCPDGYFRFGDGEAAAQAKEPR